LSANTLATLTTTQVNSLNATTLGTLDDDLLTSAFTSTQISGLTATTIDNIGALTSTQIAGLSATTIGQLNTTELNTLYGN